VLAVTTDVLVIVILDVAFTASPTSVWVEVCGLSGIHFTKLFHPILLLPRSLLDLEASVANDYDHDRLLRAKRRYYRLSKFVK
jgi:hypothetical protein